jgi:hypothetical protein
MRTKEVMKREYLDKFPDMEERIAEAHAILALSFEELLADYKSKYPDTPEEALESYIETDIALAESEINTSLLP